MLLFPPWQKELDVGSGHLFLWMVILIFCNSKAWYGHKNGGRIGFGIWCWILALTICSSGKVTEMMWASWLILHLLPSFWEKETLKYHVQHPLVFSFLLFSDMSKTCPPRRLQSRANLRHGLKCGAVRSWQNAWAFPAQPSLVPDTRELKVASKDSFVVSNQIACLDLLNVWKEPLVCMGQQKWTWAYHTPDKKQGDFYLKKITWEFRPVA